MFTSNPNYLSQEYLEGEPFPFFTQMGGNLRVEIKWRLAFKQAVCSAAVRTSRKLVYMLLTAPQCTLGYNWPTISHALSLLGSSCSWLFREAN